MLQLVFSNRTEALTAAFLARVASERHRVQAEGNLPSFDTAPLPWDEVPVLVPHAAMRRSLSLALADAQGVCAGFSFDFLGSWLWQQVTRELAGVSKRSPFDVRSMTWRVYEWLGVASHAQAFPRLQRYLQGADEVMRLELAERVAAQMDEAITFRPDWLARWRRGESVVVHPDEPWQAALWRDLADALAPDPTHPIEQFVRRIEERTVVPAPAPDVHVFALPSMPPLYLSALSALSREREVHLYVLNPCREYWFELVGPKRLSYLRLRGRAAGHESGHSLLAAWGRQTQAAIDGLFSNENLRFRDEDMFVEPEGESLLASLQRSILNLEDLAPGSLAAAWAASPFDRSLEIHVAHSRLRELEVLHDALLAAFTADPSLRPSDVLVVVPDLEESAALIDAVFGTVPPERHIPFSITGLARSRANPLARALLDALALARSRAPVSAMDALLTQDCVARRWGWDEAARTRVREWLREAGVHWGLDGNARTEWGLSSTDDTHSLLMGLRRLLFAYAMPEGSSTPLGGVAPAGSVEGMEARWLGDLWQWVEGLLALREGLRRPRPAIAWVSFLQAQLELQCATEEWPVEAAQVRAAIGDMGSAMQSAHLQSPLPAAVVLRALGQALDQTAAGGVPTGRVSFAAPSSMRGLPFRRVCVLGLDAGVFPTTQRASEFDLLAQAPRRGDPQRREDQRNLFLDLLLAARDGLYLSHVGRSQTDNQPLAPSVLLAELQDVLLPALAPLPHTAQNLETARRRLVVEHPLQSLSERAYALDADPRLRAHDPVAAQILRARQVAVPWGPVETGAPARVAGDAEAEDDFVGLAQAGDQPFIDAELPVPEAEWRDVPWDDFVRFWSGPADYFLRERLGMLWPRDIEGLRDNEAWVLDALDRTRLLDRILSNGTRDVGLRGEAGAAGGEASLAWARAQAELPPGHLGTAWWEAEWPQMQRFASRVRSAVDTALLVGAPGPHRVCAEAALRPPIASLDEELDGVSWRLRLPVPQALSEPLRSGLRVRGQILSPGGLVQWRFGRERAQDLIRFWLTHLAQCAQVGAVSSDGAPHAHWIGRGALRVGAAVEPVEAQVQLRALLAGYAKGLRSPLAFAPRSAWAYAEGEGNWRAAQQVWMGDEHNRLPPERAEPAHELAWRARPNPLNEEFAYWALAVFQGPIRHTRVEADA